MATIVPAEGPVPQDPLFEALVKYTQDEGDVNPSHVQDLISNYDSQPGGREYLEELTSTSPPSGDGMRVTGRIITFSQLLSFRFEYFEGGNKGHYSGQGWLGTEGPPAGWDVINGTLQYENLSDLLQSTEFSMQYDDESGQITIQFTNGPNVVGTLVDQRSVKKLFEQIQGTGSFESS